MPTSQLTAPKALPRLTYHRLMNELTAELADALCRFLSLVAGVFGGGIGRSHQVHGSKIAHL